VVDNPTVEEFSELEAVEQVKTDSAAPEISIITPKQPLIEEKVEVLIKESVMINPRDFSAFKHAAEEFFGSWSK